MNEITRLANILKKLRQENEDEKQKSLALHFFVIKYANHPMGFDNASLKLLLKEAEMGDSYITEIDKMLKLSKYVSIKQEM